MIPLGRKTVRVDLVRYIPLVGPLSLLVSASPGSRPPKPVHLSIRRSRPPPISNHWLQLQRQHGTSKSCPKSQPQVLQALRISSSYTVPYMACSSFLLTERGRILSLAGRRPSLTTMISLPFGICSDAPPPSGT